MSEQNIQKISHALYKFNLERGRTPLDPADLAKSIVLEAAELLEHFQRDNSLRHRNKPIPPKDKEKIGLEAADIMIYLTEFCHEMEIDLGEMVEKKIAKNANKFPVGYNAEGGHEAYLKIKKLHRMNAESSHQ